MAPVTTPDQLCTGITNALEYRDQLGTMSIPSDLKFCAGELPGQWFDSTSSVSVTALIFHIWETTMGLTHSETR